MTYTDGKNGYFGEDPASFNFTYTQNGNEVSLTLNGASETMNGTLQDGALEMEITRMTFVYKKK